MSALNNWRRDRSVCSASIHPEDCICVVCLGARLCPCDAHACVASRLRGEDPRERVRSVEAAATVARWRAQQAKSATRREALVAYDKHWREEAQRSSADLAAAE